MNDGVTSWLYCPCSKCRLRCDTWPHPVLTAKNLAGRWWWWHLWGELNSPADDDDEISELLVWSGDGWRPDRVVVTTRAPSWGGGTWWSGPRPALPPRGTATGPWSSEPPVPSKIHHILINVNVWFKSQEITCGIKKIQHILIIHFKIYCIVQYGTSFKSDDRDSKFSPLELIQHIVPLYFPSYFFHSCSLHTVLNVTLFG